MVKYFLRMFVLDEFDVFLINRVYLKIWQLVSDKEKEILKLISNGKNTNKDIINALSIQLNSLSVYKKRLSNKGIIDISFRGLIAFVFEICSCLCRIFWFDFRTSLLFSISVSAVFITLIALYKIRHYKLVAVITKESSPS